jgi:hypothetical protein
MNGRRAKRCMGLVVPDAMRPSRFVMPVSICMRLKREMFVLVAPLLENADIVTTQRVS